MMKQVMLDLAWDHNTTNPGRVKNMIHNGRTSASICPDPAKKTSKVDQCKTAAQKCLTPFGLLLAGKGPGRRNAFLQAKKDIVKGKTDIFRSSMKDKKMSKNDGESTYKSASGYGMSGLRRRSPPTAYITTSVSWVTTNPACNDFTWTFNEDICKQGMQDALDVCKGDQTFGGVANK
jgi:hypothetical protein